MAQDKERRRTTEGENEENGNAEEKLAKLIEVVSAFLKRKATIGDLRRTLKKVQGKEAD